MLDVLFLTLLAARPFTADHLVSMDRVSDPQISPDGRWVLFNVRSTDLDANKGCTDLWLVGIDGSNLKRLTTHEANDWNGRWMPDGKSVVFLSTRSGSAQVWQLPLDGGEPVQLTRFPLDVSNLHVFPDGKRLLFTLEVYPELRTLEETKKRDEEREKAAVKARVYESLLHRHWDSWEDGKRSHVFAWTIGSPAPIDLMPGFDGDAPPRPFGGDEELAISPNGREVVFTARTFDAGSAWSTNIDLWAVPADGKGKMRNLTEKNPAADELPVFSPDGKTLAYLAMQRAGYEADRRRVVLLDRQTGKTRVLTEHWDRSPSELAFAPDGKSLYATADHVGNHPLFSIDVQTGEVRPLVEVGTVRNIRPAPSSVVYTLDTLSSPADIFVLAGGGAPKPLTRMNAQRLADVQFGAFEQFSFQGAKNETVHGYLVRPFGHRGQKVPVAFIIHGGPQGSMGNNFHYRWNPQVFAGAGYAVLFIDFHGSTGYGQAFTDSIRNDWGGAPYEDLMKGLDFALKKWPFLDGQNVCALGASYGGFMVNWIAGQTDRFKCLVNHDGGFNAQSFYYETEELWFPEWEFGGTPWDNPAGYQKWNPEAHVKNWKTPMLVIHGALDYRVVDAQGLSAFTALQRKGIASKLLYFPDENHWVLKPKNSLLWHATVIGWLDRWTKPMGATSQPGPHPIRRAP